jgi:hypothetical protein
MRVESANREALDAKWQENEAELMRIALATGLDRQMLATRREALEAEQDAIEFALGADACAIRGSCCWSRS